ncbi:copper amine oxidase N-terminal domain-containing protein [Paenibacillus albidus]|uniref:copper amine oxidase N-terminal domain-containing protein n=1 Tax=Paenibacillus albidus TaxID=2041023 RepID=UPI001BE7F4AC|nr:copper amine oxidase N-terminal domain-containing protein [Paenibacillus albidus]MBT2293053.1 copper amine oxidase N-terminal domain-containing protein [Paenibacillus albidus]
MRRSIKVCLSGLVLTSVFSAGVYAATAVPKILVNGNQVKTSVQPKIINGSVYVPIRAVSEGFGANMNWDNKTKSLYVNSDPNFKTELSRDVWVGYRNMVNKWIMAYDERDFKIAEEQMADDFTTDIYKSFPTGGTTESSSIIDFKVIGYEELNEGKQVKLTYRTVYRPIDFDYTIRVQDWSFIVYGNQIHSAKIVPNSTKYLDRYTIVPNANFGNPLK